MDPVLLGPPLKLGRSTRAAVGEVGNEEDSRAEAAAAAAAASAWSRCGSAVQLAQHQRR